MDNYDQPLLRDFLVDSQIFLNEHGLDGDNIRYYWMMAFDWDLTDLVVHYNSPVTPGQKMSFEEILERLISYEPIQYIVGYADFLNRRFHVTRDTLIPREETTELIYFAEKFLQKYPKAKVLDIGTGSGIISVTLKSNHPNIHITASDISQEALKVAHQNGTTHAVEVNWVLSDLTQNLADKYDLIISNPPYVGKAELEQMDESVKRYEPPLSLFAGEDGLDIYRRLIQELPEKLNPGGLIVLEIGYLQGEAVSTMFQAAFPTAEIQVHQDFNQLDRMVTVQLPQEAE